MRIHENILEELRAKNKLPSLPKLINKLLDLMNDPVSSLDDISTIIALDPAMGGRILRLANSVSFGFSEKTGSINEAIGRIGIQATCDVVVSMALINTFQKNELIDLDKFWIHSLSVAFAAQKIEKEAQKIQGLSEESYTAGLFHDLGILVLVSYFEEQYAQVIQTVRTEQKPLVLVEQEQLGITHPEASHILLKYWGIPEIISTAARMHQSPNVSSEGISPGDRMAQVIHMANFACNQQGVDNGIDCHSVDFLQSIWFDMGLSEESIPAIIEGVNRKVEAANSILNAAKS